MVPPLHVLAVVQPLSIHIVPRVWRPPTDLPLVPTPLPGGCRPHRWMSTRRGWTHFEWKLLLAVAGAAAVVLAVRQLTMSPVAEVLAGRVVQSPADPSPVVTDLVGKLRPASVPWFIWFVQTLDQLLMRSSTIP